MSFYLRNIWEGGWETSDCVLAFIDSDFEMRKLDLGEVKSLPKHT